MDFLEFPNAHAPEQMISINPAYVAAVQDNGAHATRGPLTKFTMVSGAVFDVLAPYQEVMDDMTADENAAFKGSPPPEISDDIQPQAEMTAHFHYLYGHSPEPNNTMDWEGQPYRMITGKGWVKQS